MEYEWDRMDISMDLSCPPNWMGSVILQLLRMENKHKQHKIFLWTTKD